MTRERLLTLATAGALSFAAVLVGAPALAHGGGTNAECCHTNRKTGDYHCHGGKAASSSARTARQTSAPQRAYGGGGSTYYANCSAARAAGAAPVRRGDPGYSSKLDRDGDGVGCE